MTVSATPGQTSADLLGITSYETAQSSAKTSGKAGEEMGKQDFLTLFTAQLKNQNPLDPVKNEAFVAQLAQFSQLEALTNMSTSLNGFITSMSAQQMYDGAALIGKKVPNADGTGVLGASGGIDATIALPDGASGVKVQVKDASGKVVQELIAGAQNPGNLDFNWDGTDTSGNRVAAGSYKFTATAVVAAATQNVGVQTLSTVRSVTKDAATGDVTLELEGGSTLSMAKLSRIVN